MTGYLPPLPTLPGEGFAYHYHPPGRSILELLAAEHELLHTLSAELRLRPSRNGSSILCAQICRHLSAERQYLYPTVAKALAGSAADAAVAGLLEIDERLLSDADTLLRSPPASGCWDEALGRVGDQLRKHAHRCATQLFTPLEWALGDTDLVRLGNRLEIAQETAPSRPHPHLPRGAPWNRATDALAGAVDKLRDVFTGRKTYSATPADR